MTQIITIDQKQEWVSYIRRSAEHDFYHTWHYHSLDTSGDPILFVYEEAERFIAFPMIKRKIDNSQYSDLTSVYGYPGPVSNPGFENMEDDLMENFKREFLNFLKNGRIVSVFSRLHPFMKQQSLIDKFGGVFENGRTVAIDLTVPIEVQRSKYRETVYASIKQLWRKGYHIKESKTIEDIRVFIDIYTENMKRIGATDYYLFNEQYFIEYNVASP